ncbi:UNVERIFIED_CONTAM: Choline/ethanolaminephosphotransferase 2 [Sesamum latifolium]|uniref:Choline/ethanolaminephosphotransferase 2 n=1 Tax=Sesamum latifolium TaxID=2727402 RepID=A0AAW2YDA4_9LAMI
MGYIGAHGAAALHKHKYSGVDNSVLAKYVLQPFWTRCVNLFPLWMPINVFGYICIAWIYIFTSTGFTSSKMGAFCPRIAALLISRCDALGCAFESLAFGSTAMCGGSTFWFWVISAVPFYCATWEYYFTKTLILPVVNGPTEGLMLIYMIHFFTAIVGAQWWAQQFGKSIPFLNWIPFVKDMTMYKAALFLMIIFAVIPTISCNVYNVYKVVQARKGSMLLALAMLYPFVVLLSGVLVWDYLSPSDLMGNYPHLVIVGIGLAFGFLVGRLILAHLCDEPKGLKTNMCMSLFYLPFAIANALTARLNDGVPLVDEFWILLGFVAYTDLNHSARSLNFSFSACSGSIFAFCHISCSRDNNSPGDLLLQNNQERSIKRHYHITWLCSSVPRANSSSTEQFLAGNFNFANMAWYWSLPAQFFG